MLFGNYKQIFTLPTVLLLLCVLVFGFFCIERFSNEISLNHENSLGQVHANYLQTASTCCGGAMSPHTDVWKLVAGSVTRDTSAITIALVSLVVWRRLLSNKIPYLNFILYRLYKKERFNLVGLSRLRLAFARGIINPKKY